MAADLEIMVDIIGWMFTICSNINRSKNNQRNRRIYKQQDKQTNIRVRKMIRADKCANMEDLAREAEEAATRGKYGKCTRSPIIISGRSRGSTDAPIAVKQGRQLTTEAEQQAPFVENFNEVLSRSLPSAEADIQ